MAQVPTDTGAAVASGPPRASTAQDRLEPYRDVMEQTVDTPDRIHKGRVMVFSDTGEPASIASQIRAQYLLEFKPEQLEGLRAALGEEAFGEFVLAQAAGMYPAFAKQILAGARPDLLVAPYANLASRELERAVDSDDSAVRDYLMMTEKPTLAEFLTYVKSLPEWDNTSNARRQVARFMDVLSLGGLVEEDEHTSGELVI